MPRLTTIIMLTLVATAAASIAAAIPVAPAAPAGTDQALNIGFHQDLQHCLGYGS